MTNTGRRDRVERRTQRKSGAWATTSQDLLEVASRLYWLSEHESKSSSDKNHSMYIYGGIPLLLGALCSFTVEYERMLSLGPLPDSLGDPPTQLMSARYGVSGELLKDLTYLVAIRNELSHPVPMPTGTPDNWPEYLKAFKQKGLLHTTGNPACDYIMLGQIASHRLFIWAVDVTRRLYVAVIQSDANKAQHFQRFGDDNFKAFFGARAIRFLHSQ